VDEHILVLDVRQLNPQQCIRHAHGCNRSDSQTLRPALQARCVLTKLARWSAVLLLALWHPLRSYFVGGSFPWEPVLHVRPDCG
jgi:hypothetical protein